MPLISPIDPAATSGRTRELLDGLQKALGMTPNMMKTMARSPAVLDAYMSFNRALSNGALAARLREQIAVAVADSNGCDYCLSAHTFLGQAAGLSVDELTAARNAGASDRRAAAGLEFVRQIVRDRGHVSAHTVAAIREAGYSDAQIAELIAEVALNIFTNYFNVIAGTEIDFPVVSTARAA